MAGVPEEDNIVRNQLTDTLNPLTYHPALSAPGSAKAGYMAS